MKIYKSGNTALIEQDNQIFQTYVSDWDKFLNRENLREEILHELKDYVLDNDSTMLNASSYDAPMGNHEIWAAGVTYLRSKVEREKESGESGAAVFYDKVYEAERPELFFKANAYRTVGSGRTLNIRKDSSWNVPEPELTLFINSKAQIQGYTIGNDLSSRSIEGENPLYLPQAKTWDKCAAIGPCIYLPEESLPEDTKIEMRIIRNEVDIFEGSTDLRRMKRTFEELVEFLFRECKFPDGCFLMTGTGVVPPEDFSLRVGDEVRISIDGIGELVNLLGMDNPGHN